MRIKDNLTTQEYKSIKESFFHIYHHFLNLGPVKKEFVSCMFKWGLQLHLREDELVHYLENEDNLNQAIEKVDLLEHLYNLVYVIYLDDVVEDVELKMVSEFAEHLGFKPHIVNDLLKTIVTAPYDGYSYQNVRVLLQELLEVSS